MTTSSSYCDDFHFCSGFKELKWSWLLALRSFMDRWKTCSHLLLCVMLQSGPERLPSPSLPWPKPPTLQKPRKSFGTVLGSSTAPSFWLSALVTWIQFHASSTAAGFCLACEKHGWRAFLTLRTCSHSYIS